MLLSPAPTIDSGICMSDSVKPTVSPVNAATAAAAAAASATASATSVLHALLILSDSALPLGSFAYSNGLESFLAHEKAELIRRRAERPDVVSLASKLESIFWSGSAATPLSQPLGQTSMSPTTTTTTIPTKTPAPVPTATTTMLHFLTLSLQSAASTCLPFLLAAHRHPSRLVDVDDQMDATMTCEVGRKASTSQGRALIGVWDRSLGVECEVSLAGDELGRSSIDEGVVVTGDDVDVDDSGDDGDAPPTRRRRRAAVDALNEFSRSLKANKSTEHDDNADSVEGTISPSSPYACLLDAGAAHLAPLFALVALAHGIDARTTAFIFLFSHLKAVTSAAVRTGLIGPYSAQAVLARAGPGGVAEQIERCVDEFWGRYRGGDGDDTEEARWERSCGDMAEAGQQVPVMDLWTGRHGMVYSRLFNS